MRYVIAEHVIFHPVSGELVLLDIRSGEYLGLDEIGSEVWCLLNDGVEVDEITTRMAARHHGDPATVGTDLDTFLGELCDAELIRPAD